jgi:serine/threonine protein kinase
MNEDLKRVGTILGGRYRIQDVIARGGMSTVYRGSHLTLGRRVAVKIFHAYLAEDLSLVKRFMNEAIGTARLNHPNIVDIHDMGMDSDNVPFFIMELLEGESLHQRLKRQPRRLTVHHAADVMVQILDGLELAHSRGITHRDLKPSNVFLARGPDGIESVKILDFGIARFRELESEDRDKLTLTGTVLGTPEYMSIEQARAQREAIDERSDLYSCGVILYRCLTGISPMKGKSQFETVRNIYRRAVRPPSEAADGIPPGIDALVLKAMAREKEKRFQDCRSFREAMKFFYEVESPPLPVSPFEVSLEQDEPETQNLSDSMQESGPDAPTSVPGRKGM